MLRHILGAETDYGDKLAGPRVLCPQPISNALLRSNERSADFSDGLVAKLVQPLNFLLLHVKLLNERRGFRSVRGVQQTTNARLQISI